MKALILQGPPAISAACDGCAKLRIHRQPRDLESMCPPNSRVQVPRVQNLIRVCRVFDDRRRAVAAPSCNGRRVSDVLEPDSHTVLIWDTNPHTPEPFEGGLATVGGSASILLLIADCVTPPSTSTRPLPHSKRCRDDTQSR